MLYYTLITKNCQNDAQRYGVQPDIHKNSKKVEDDQTIANWDNFFPEPFVKKNLGNDFRLIAAYVKLKDKIYIVFLTVIPRGNTKYHKNPMTYVKNNCHPLIPQEKDLLNSLEKRQAEEKVIHQIPKANQIEYSYLYDVAYKMSDDLKSEGMIYESLDWIELMNNPEIADDISRYYDILWEIINDTNISEKEHIVKHSREKNIEIVYKYYSKNKLLFLIAPINKSSISSKERMINKYKNYIERDEILTEKLLSKSGRAYPVLIFADTESLWKEIQSNEEGNIALSPEESEILESILHRDENSKFPLFINGRPGSGKSTLLQYIFANQLYCHLRKDIKQRLKFPPVYLTYSERLVDNAKKNVRTVIRCNANLVLNKASETINRELEALLPRSFWKFDEFLMNFLNSDQKKRYRKENKIDFRKFKRLWIEKIRKDPDAELRKFSPEMVWHVIRSYLKGMADDNNQHLDDIGYNELPAKQKTVNQSTFKKIYNKVFLRWYHPLCISEKFWDDQDLSRFVLSNIDRKELAKYPGIFCDEAQDFTKIELELIFKLSLFSYRILEAENLKRVPFAFAGDPFQTLNPTGFDWDCVQASFHEKIIQQLDRLGNAKLKFNYQELSFNYRSSKNIVGIGNLIQLLRGNLFNIKGLKPQLNWFDDEREDPIYFDIDDPSCQRKLEEESEQIIIIPCQEGEEQDFVESDEFLKKISGRDMRNNLSPMSAKGLEFNRVVLFNFGKDYIKNYTNLMDPIAKKIEFKSKELALPYEYFMNRLYVAVSRAKKRLIIVDTKDGLKEFWLSDVLKNTESLIESYNPLTAIKWNSKNLSLIQPGSAEAWDKDRDDPLKLAINFEEQGVLQQDTYFLKLAEQNYQRAGRPDSALKCRALRYEYDFEMEKAGDTYLHLKNPKRALECYWETLSFNRILAHDEFSGSIEHRAADFMIQKKSEHDAFKFLQYISRQLNRVIKNKITDDDTWQTIFQEVIKVLSESKNQDKSFNKSITILLEKLTEEEIILPSTKAHGLIYYFAGHDDKAINIWDDMQNPPKNEIYYLQAIANVTSYPDNVESLYRLRNYEKLSSQFIKYKNTPITSNQANMVAQALLDSSELKLLFELVKKYKLMDIIDDIIKSFDQSGRKTRLFMNYHELKIQLLTEKKEILDALDFVKSVKSKDVLSTRVNALMVYKMATVLNHREFEKNDLNKIADYLKKLLIDTEWDNSLKVKVAGAAIENTYRIVEALQFYELVWDKRKIRSVSNLEMDYCKRRWLKVKKRYIDYLKEEKVKEQLIKKHTTEFEMRRKDFNISIKAFVEMEEIPTIEPADFSLDEVHRQSILTKLDESEQIAIESMYKSNASVEQIAQAIKKDTELVISFIELNLKDDDGK